jgi:hypothetical protein
MPKIRKSRLDVVAHLIKKYRSLGFSLLAIQIHLKNEKITVSESAIMRFCFKHNIPKGKSNNQKNILTLEDVINNQKCIINNDLVKKDAGYSPASRRLFNYTTRIDAYREENKPFQYIVDKLSDEVVVHRTTVSRFCKLMGI